MKMLKLAALLIGLVLAGGGAVFGQEAGGAAPAASAVDKADTAWVLISAALVLLMAPGLAFFYGGLVRRKNVLSILVQCFMIMCLIGLQWVLFGYSLAFGPDFKGLIGDLSWLGLRNVSCALPHWDPVTGSSYAGAIPHQAFMTFQMMFAVITPAAGFVNVNGALWIGIGAGVLPWICISVLKPKLNFDDALDVFGVHGVGGLWGALATGLWATKAVNPAGADGLFYGQPGQFLVQLEAVAIVLGYSLAASYGLLKLVDWLVRLRVNEHEERVGLDLTQHREAGYTLLD